MRRMRVLYFLVCNQIQRLSLFLIDELQLYNSMHFCKVIHIVKMKKLIAPFLQANQQLMHKLLQSLQ